jgi:hypothetical protein
MIVFIPMLLATVGGLIARRRWALMTSLTAACVGVLMAAACGGSGHHAGFWPLGQLLGFAALAWLSIGAMAAHPD